MSTPMHAIDRPGDGFVNAAAPRWAEAGRDDAHGGFFEALDGRGGPVPGLRRARARSRQTYAFSMIAARGWLADAPLAVDVPASLLYHLFEAVAATPDNTQHDGTRQDDTHQDGAQEISQS